MYSKQKIMLILGLLLLSNTLRADELAIKRFQAALGACERALQMEMPKSRGSLKILQSLQKRYQRNKESALALEESLKDSTEHHYNGEFFADETFKQAFQTCESELVAKMSQAEKIVSEKVAEREDKQQAQETIVETLIKKIETAEQQVKIAVEDNCVIYLQAIMEAGDDKLSLPKTKIASLQRAYKKAKQKALEIYPDITKQFYTASITDPFTAEEKQENRVVANWFNYCEEMFAEQTPEGTASALVGPKLPESDKKSSAPSESTVGEGEETHSEEKETSEPVVVKKTMTKKEETAESAVKKVEKVSTEKEKMSEPVVEKTTTKKEETAESAVKKLEKINTEKEEASKPVVGNTQETGVKEKKETLTTAREKIEKTTPPVDDEETDTAEEASPPEPVDDESAEKGELPSELTDEELAEEDSVDYQKIISAMREDRAKILKENKRLPDYVNNDEDDFQAATVWQYEDDGKCAIYQFRDDKLVRTKVVPGECPEF